MSMKKETFGHSKEGKTVTRYILENNNGMKAAFLDMGAVISNIWLPDKNGNIDDIVHGYDKVEKYEVNTPSFGAPIGRCANRISGGRFTMNGKEYILDQNDDTNCLHGGFLRYNYQMYDVDYEAGEGEEILTFSRVSPDGEQHFPGTFTYSISYHLTDLNELIIHYHGVSGADTIVSMTNHSYFNLGKGGHTCHDVLDHEVKILAHHYTPSNELHLPTGEIADVKGTVWDFTEFKKLGAQVVTDESSPDYFLGYDDNFVLDHPAGEMSLAAVYRVLETGRQMEVFTDLPGMQLYTAPEMIEEDGKDGMTYGTSSAVCFESQTFPNAMNTPSFPDIILRAGEEYDHTTIFRFSMLE